MTADLDLVIDLSEKNVARFCHAMAQEEFEPALPVDPLQIADPNVRETWITSKHMVAFPFRHRHKSYIVIDVLIESPVSIDTLMANAQQSDTMPVVSVAHIDDIITMKQASGRQQDLADIQSLEKVKAHDA